MSLTDPQSHWWNKDFTRRTIAYFLIALSLVSSLVGMFHVMAQEASPFPEWVFIPLALSLPLLLGGVFLIGFGTASSDVSTKLVVWPLAGMFIMLGVGGLVGGYVSPRGFEWWHLQYAIFALGGVITLVLSGVLGKRSSRNQALAKQVERSGIAASATVTRARSYVLNYVPMTKVTVKFTDSEGNTRWASDTIGGNVSKGQRMRVKYLQEHLGHKAAVVVTRL